MHTTMMEAEVVQDQPGAQSVLHLLVMSPDAFSSIPLPASGSLAVGRSAKCRIRLDDPLVSREHALMHVNLSEQGYSLQIEDLGSANGTRVRDRPIGPKQCSSFLPGEAITIGSTVLMVQHNRPAVGLRRLWSHGYFESRLEDECARAAETGSVFGLARVRLTGVAPWTKVMPVLVRTIPQPYLFASYGPRDYEILFVESPPQKVMKLMDGLVRELHAKKIEARHGVAWYPRDGRSADALIARANALVKQPSGAGKTDRVSARRAAGAQVFTQGTKPPPITSTLPDDDGSDEEPMNGAGMERILDLAKRAAGANINVLILGETGVGKDVLARTVHRLSGRRGDFVALNCAGLSPTLIESELFGHERGAFSGAVGSKIGLLEAANGGTVFLDEIGEMPSSLQVKLLRTIETREVLPVGAVRTRAIDVRFLAATNRDLEADVLRGTFRQDLFFRLNGITLAVPPLRERTHEIPALVATFIHEACRESGREPRPVFSRIAQDHLRSYAWPGNIREMKNVVERALVLCDEEVIGAEYLPLDKMRTLCAPYESANGGRYQVGMAEASSGGAPAADSDARADIVAVGAGSGLRLPIGMGMGVGGEPFAVAADPAESSARGIGRTGAGATEGDTAPPSMGSPSRPSDDPEPNETPERQRILDALASCAWNQTRAAQSLGMPRRTFVSKLEHYRIPRPQKPGSAPNGPVRAP